MSSRREANGGANENAPPARQRVSPERPPSGPSAGQGRYATIDIGTNSVLLLVAARRPDGAFEAVEEDLRLTRLGADVDRTGVLAPEPMRATVEAATQFAGRARALGAEGLAITATSAARDAANGAEFLRALEEATGARAEILSGDEEAALTYESAARDFGGGPLLALDIGGGSTEVVAGEGGAVTYRHSFDLGCVRLTERWLRGDPPTPDELAALRRDVAQGFAQIPPPPPGATLVGIAGTATTLCALHLGLPAYDGERVHGARLALAEVHLLAERLGSMPLEERLALPGLAPKRADVIVAGAEILAVAMERLGLDEVVISDKGVRWGLLYRRFAS